MISSFICCFTLSPQVQGKVNSKIRRGQGRACCSLLRQGWLVQSDSLSLLLLANNKIYYITTQHDNVGPLAQNLLKHQEMSGDH